MSLIYDQKLSNFLSYVYFVPTLIAISFLATGCWIYYCLDAQCMSPHLLLDSNDYVFLGNMSEVRTVDHFGSIEYFGDTDSVFLLEYAFDPTEMIKGDSGMSTHFLWFLESIRLKDGYNSGLQISQNSIELIYGNMILNHEDLLNLIYPLTLRRKHKIVELLDGQLPDWEETGDWSFDSTIAVRLLGSDKVKIALQERAESMILYGTDAHYFTSKFFRRGHLQYCDEDRQEGDYVDSDTYLKRLRVAARNCGPKKIPQ